MVRDFTLTAMFSRKVNNSDKYLDTSVSLDSSCSVVNVAGVTRLLSSGCLGLSWLAVCECEGSFLWYYVFGISGSITACPP